MDNINLVNFSFQDRPLRVIEVGGEPWFVAKDVAGALGYIWQPNLVSHVPDEWKGINPINTPGGKQDILCLSEPGLYFFLGRSDKPLALPYQKWIAGDVVPSIRKKGVYAVPGKDQEEQDAWKKNFPYPFLLQENADRKMREMRLGMAKGVVSAKEYRRVVLGDFSRPFKPDTSVVAFVENNLEITGNEKDFAPVEEVYRRYELQAVNGMSRNTLTRKIRNNYPALGYKQKKIDGYPVLVFFGCKMLNAPAPAMAVDPEPVPKGAKEFL
jgi:prophage antirepressor-like protein